VSLFVKFGEMSHMGVLKPILFLLTQLRGILTENQ